MKKHLLDLLLVLTLIVSLTACGGAGAASSAKETPTERRSREVSRETETTEAPTAAPESQSSGTAAEVSADALVFETTDLDGTPVSSAELFAGYQLTMVNIWGTFCGPCIREMPDLEVLNSRLKEKGCAIVGLVCDVAGPDDERMIAAAEEIIADTHVTYLNLVPWEGWYYDLEAEFVPTTYFVNQKGEIVGEAAIGARGADDYEALVEEVLAGLE